MFRGGKGNAKGSMSSAWLPIWLAAELTREHRAPSQHPLRSERPQALGACRAPPPQLALVEVLVSLAAWGGASVLL